MKKLIILIFILSSLISKGQGGHLVVNGWKQSACSDSAALAWIDSTGITDATTVSAMCAFVKQLKDSSIYTKIYAAWFLAAGTSSAAKWNIVNAHNTDGSYRLTFAGSTTFSTGGAAWDGSTGYADTHVDLSAILSASNGGMWYYSRTNSNAGSPYDMGASDDAGAVVRPSYLITRYSTNNAFGGWADATYGCSASSTDSRGFFGISHTGTASDLVKNGVSVGSDIIGSSLSSQSVYLGANDGAGAAALFSDKQCAFAAITDGMTSTEWRKFYNCVQAFMTALGINV